MLHAVLSLPCFDNEREHVRTFDDRLGVEHWTSLCKDLEGVEKKF